jgi:hypothetical protein
MDRLVLLALLGIPILVIVPAALFWQRLPSDMVLRWAGAPIGARERAAPRAHSLPAHFDVEYTPEQGS